MQRYWKAAVIALLAIFILIPGGLARADDRDGGSAGPDLDSRAFVDPDFYPGYYGFGSGWGWSNPWYGGWWGSPSFYTPRTGDVEIITKQKDASVYVDGGYVGRAGKVRKIPLKPGPHAIQLRNSSGQVFYQKRVFVVRGKALKLDVRDARRPSRTEPAYSHAAPVEVLGAAGKAKARQGNG